MPDRPKRSTSLSDDSDAGLDAALNAAREAVRRRADNWTIEPRLYDRLRTDLDAIGHTCNEPAATAALRVALSEIPKIRRREDRSYSGLEEGQVLYDCRWKSNYFKRTMYLKFAWNGEMVELFTLHEHKAERQP